MNRSMLALCGILLVTLLTVSAHAAKPSRHAATKASPTAELKARQEKLAQMKASTPPTVEARPTPTALVGAPPNAPGSPPQPERPRVPMDQVVNSWAPYSYP